MHSIIFTFNFTVIWLGRVLCWYYIVLNFGQVRVVLHPMSRRNEYMYEYRTTQTVVFKKYITVFLISMYACHNYFCIYLLQT